MHTVLAVFLSSLVSLASLSGPGNVRNVQQGARSVPVLEYHNLVTGDPGRHATSKSPASAPGDTSVKRFTREMKWLHDHGYHTLGIKQFDRFMQGGKVPRKSVLLTFDDGYRSVYTRAYPVLQHFGMKATLFIIGSSTGKTPGRYPHLTRADLKRMVKHGIDVEEHTWHAHNPVEGKLPLCSLSYPEIREDFDRETQLIKKITGQQPLAMAWPHGKGSKAAVEAGHRAGIGLFFGGPDGLATPQSPRTQIPRLYINGQLSLKGFARKILNAKPVTSSQLGCGPTGNG